MRYTLLAILAFYSAAGWSQVYTFNRVDTIPVHDVGQYANPWVGGLNTTQISTIDLNGDALDDLFVFDRVGDKITTYINIGSVGVDSYEHAPQYENKFPSDLRRWVLLRDFDGDGKKDIFGYTPGGSKVWRNASTGTLSFTVVTSVLKSQQGAFYNNIYVSGTDIPSIDDIDGDGDLDIVSFDQFGKYLEYHRNLSQETYGHSDSLNFELRNRCWGHFSESGSTNSVILYDTCDNSDLTVVESPGMTPKQHFGSTVTTIDINGNGVKDVLIGDVMFNNVVMLENGGTTPNSNSSMTAQDTAFPAYDVPVDIQIFPAMFYEDIDNDGVRDLLVTCNAENLGEDNTSIHLFKNTGTDASPIFSFQQNNFLQSEMIDVGTGAIPVFFDHNSDGLDDLIISNFGTLNKLSGDYEPQVWLFENIGTANAPEFQLITKKYMNINTSGVDKNVVITFGDLDNDGDEDMMVGDYNGALHYFTNTAGAGATANFVLTQPNYQDDMGSVIDVGLQAAPWLYDLDGDLDLDMVVGEWNGNLNFYENKGSVSIPLFSLKKDTLGDIPAFISGGDLEMTIPRLFKNSAGETELFIGTKSGEIMHFSNIDTDILGTYTLADAMVANSDEGPNTAPALADINGDGYIDMILGTQRGGTVYYAGSNPNNVSEYESLDFTIYPNPTNSSFVLRGIARGHYTINSVSGQEVQKGVIKDGITIDLSLFNSGIYLLRIEFEGKFGIKKLIKL